MRFRYNRFVRVGIIEAHPSARVSPANSCYNRLVGVGIIEAFSGGRTCDFPGVTTGSSESASLKCAFVVEVQVPHAETTGSSGSASLKREILIVMVHRDARNNRFVRAGIIDAL